MVVRGSASEKPSHFVIRFDDLPQSIGLGPERPPLPSRRIAWSTCRGSQAVAFPGEGGNCGADSRLSVQGELRLRHLQRSDATQNVTGPVLAGVAVLALTGLASVPFLNLGPLSLQMLQHLAVMNIAAPVLALGLPPAQAMRRGSLLAPATLQLVILWAWHMPALQQLAAASALAQIGLMAMLAASAVWFWHAIIGAARSGGWQALGALLLTGKLACLLGALLIFAPRDL